jgi:nicotinate-nucleotide adenylyltransferase
LGVNERTVLLLMGGSFDPVHAGHVAVASYFCKLLMPDALRLLPAGDPWQKAVLHASAAHRVAMLKLAFAASPIAVQIDEQEIVRGGGSYTIDTLRALRDELGNQASLNWIIGADQLQRFHTWRDWQTLFELANFVVAARPGYSLQAAGLDAQVAHAFARRQASADQLRDCAHGLTLFASALAFDVSSSAVRAAFAQGGPQEQSLPGAVLDYVEQHQLYRS